MNVCELNKFIDISDKMDNYQFNPVDEVAIISKGAEKIIIDLNASVSVQLAEFQDFVNNIEG